MEYSLKQVKNAKNIAYEHNDNTPLVIPCDCHLPETTNQAIARILKHSGVIDDNAYEKLRGMEYDYDYDENESFDDDDEFYDDDEFEQSSFASYIENDFREAIKVDEANKHGKKPSVASGSSDNTTDSSLNETSATSTVDDKAISTESKVD